MSKLRKSISQSEKEEILSESDKPDCVITELAKKYDVRAGLIYSWRKKRSESVESVGNHKFIEVIAEEAKESEEVLSITHIETEMHLEEFRFSISGKISNSKYKSLIELLVSVC